MYTGVYCLVYTEIDINLIRKTKFLPKLIDVISPAPTQRRKDVTKWPPHPGGRKLAYVHKEMFILMKCVKNGLFSLSF